MMVLYAFPIVTFGLGSWQLYRLQWKLDLIKEAEQALHQKPIQITTTTKSSDLVDSMLVEINGSFDPKSQHEFHLGPRINDGDPGSCVISPFVLSSGDRVLVNRGWVHRDQLVSKSRFSAFNSDQKLIGFLRRDIKQPSWSPDNQPTSNQWFWADLNTMSTLAQTSPILIEAIESDANNDSITSRKRHGIPIPRPREVHLSNNHLQYAVTWYSLSAATALMLFFKRRPKFFS